VRECDPLRLPTAEPTFSGGMSGGRWKVEGRGGVDVDGGCGCRCSQWMVDVDVDAVSGSTSASASASTSIHGVMETICILQV